MFRKEGQDPDIHKQPFGEIESGIEKLDAFGGLV